jgi:hypothetical protein
MVFGDRGVRIPAMKMFRYDSPRSLVGTGSGSNPHVRLTSPAPSTSPLPLTTNASHGLNPGIVDFRHLAPLIPNTAIEHIRHQPNARFPEARRKRLAHGASRRVCAYEEKPRPGACIQSPQRPSPLRTGLNSYAPAELNRLRPVWLLIYRAVHPPGENLLLS